MNSHERRIRARMDWALAERNKLNDRIFEEGRAPSPEEWREIQGFNRIYTDCCELLTKLNQEDPRFSDTLAAVREQCDTMRAILNQLNKVNEYKTKNYLGDVDILDIGKDKRRT